MVSLIIIGCYGTNLFVNNFYLIVPIPTLSALIALIIMLYCIISYFISNPKSISALALFLFILTVLLIFSLITSDSKIILSALIMLAIAGVFSSLFGTIGIVVLLLSIISYLLYLYFNNQFTLTYAIVYVIFGIIPVLSSPLIWHSLIKSDLSENKLEDNKALDQITPIFGKMPDAPSQAIINAIGDGIISINVKGIIESINPAAQKLLGWSQKDALSLDYNSVLNLKDKNYNDLPDNQNPIYIALNTNKQIRSNDLTVSTRNDRHIFLSLVVSPLSSVSSGVIIVFRDISADKKREEEQTEFISTASHEMRTPIATIEGYLGLTLNPNTATVDSRARNFIAKAHESAQHLGRLFEDLLDVSKADDNRMSNNPKIVNIPTLVTDIAVGLTPKAEQKGLKIINDTGKINNGGEKNIQPLFYVNLDNDHIREIVSNLLDNAIKYTQSGSVTIDVTGDDNKVTIAIKDTGIGIRSEDQPHLFQKFYRVDNSDTRQIGGTGLGLYLCRKLAESMNGRIWVNSTYGKGSTFYVELPRIGSQEAEELLKKQQIAEEANKKAEVEERHTKISDKKESDLDLQKIKVDLARRVLDNNHDQEIAPPTPEQIAKTYYQETGHNEQSNNTDIDTGANKQEKPEVQETSNTTPNLPKQNQTDVQTPDSTKRQLNVPPREYKTTNRQPQVSPISKRFANDIRPVNTPISDIEKNSAEYVAQERQQYQNNIGTVENKK